MNTILDITGDDIADLSDSDLRTLIGLLCEEECNAHNYSPSGVTWGGHQDAKDGGLDVRVQLEGNIQWGFIPRANTGFQVKKPDMSVKAIQVEMKPNGILRKSIISLIKSKGSYIIVSSAGSTTDKALNDRREAMQAAVRDEKDYEQIHLDFYDRGRIATWVRTRPTLIPWVREKVGKQLTGWQPYGNWSQPGKSIVPFIIDKKVRLYDGTNLSADREIGILAGLSKIRTLLASPGTSVRLTGLSGVGKTRFVQALFEGAVGDHTLNPNQVIYTDVANEPEPNPILFLQKLLHKQAKGVMVVDNCQPDLHATLTAQVTTPLSDISLITIEYDVREDLPDETNSFRLEPASEELIFALLRKQFPSIGEVNTERIAALSGGNARIAISLANTVGHGDNLTGFNNEALFNRLFWQRNEIDKPLKQAAEALSLVYSFEGTEIDTGSELAQLGLLIEQSADTLYRYTGELKNRDLIQSRHVWRALLPHAIANKLARQALKHIHPNHLISIFIQNGSERLRKSFSRRLGYLHDSQEAITLIESWLNVGGWLSQLENLTKSEIDIVVNIAPVSPRILVLAFERAINKPKFSLKSTDNHKRFVSLLRQLAFDADLFIQCTRMMSVIALAEQEDNASKNALTSLFQALYSGTHAPVETRYILIEELLNSAEVTQNNLGLQLLNTALKTEASMPWYSFDFGARPRDYGYRPRNREEIDNWYGFLLKKCFALIESKVSYASIIKKILADRFRDLWLKASVTKQFLDIAQKIRSFEAWNEAWIEVRRLIQLYTRQGKEVSIELINLNNLLEPTNLLDQIDAYALQAKSMQLIILDEDSVYSNLSQVEIQSLGRQKADNLAFELSKQLANDSAKFNYILPKLIEAPGQRVVIIGRGLVAGSKQHQFLWETIRKQVEQTNEQKRNVILLVGFLQELYLFNKILADSILNKILQDPILSPYFLNFQTGVPIDKQGITRIHTALDNNIMPISQFQLIINGLAAKSIPDADLASLLSKLTHKEGGNEIAIDILYFRLQHESSESLTPTLVETGRLLLTSYSFSHLRRSQDEELSKIAAMCLLGESAVQPTTLLCHLLIDAILSDEYSDYLDQELVTVLAKNQPNVFLDSFVASDRLEDYQLHNFFDSVFGRNNPLDVIDDTILITWCERSPNSHFPKIAEFISMYSSNDSGQLIWRSIFYYIVENSTCLDKVLAAISEQLTPRAWEGPLIYYLEPKLKLFEQLVDHEISMVADWAKQVNSYLKAKIQKDNNEEKIVFKNQYDSFE